jgi:topoisomerase IV subunit A
MAKKNEELPEQEPQDPNAKKSETHTETNIVSLGDMYENYFLDYASYVILERAVPIIEDGLKPVQRRILHAMKEMDDGRYHKVANIIGQTMQYHPHGDAAIGDALVNIGQKDLLIDCQGNWGDAQTGDSAAAARYIEARLTKFGLEVVFNPQTTEWQLSYDGRKKEPVSLPVKFPLLLTQGVEGIAVGLSTKILPHNFVELIKASIDILKGRKVEIFPDFPTGGMIDITNYNAGKRGSRVRVRARIKISDDKKSLLIKEIPFGTTTGDLIESILKAAEKNKIKIKRITDNTAKDLEILIELQPNTSPDVSLDALYAFTNCELSISPSACVIIDNKPIFLDVNEMLRTSTENTKELLRRELEIRKGELEEKWHMSSLEKIFIENRIYRQIEEAESWTQVLEIIPTALRKYVREPETAAAKNDTRVQLLRAISEEDVVRLTEIRIKRISKYNTFEADEYMKRLLEELEQVKHHLANLTEFAIRYFEDLLKKYGKGRERKTEIRVFDTIQASEVVANNAKLYVNRKDGFIGTGIKKDEFVSDCSDIDDIFIFRKDGKFQVVKVADKVFVGKDILYIAVWRKGDDRTTYNLIYSDGKSGVSYAKRFNVTAITRATEYDLTQGTPNSKVLYFTANLNGESEVVQIQLSQNATARVKQFDFDFSTLAIKGRASQGNQVTKFPVRQIKQASVGKSTLGAKKWWFDDITGRVNDTERGRYLGEFDTGDSILLIYKTGAYEVVEADPARHFEPTELIFLGKLTPDTVVSALHFDGNKEWTMLKRFKIETTKLGEKFVFISDHKKSLLLFATTRPHARVSYSMKIGSKKMDGEVNLSDFVDIKGWKAMGNRVSDQKLTSVKEIEPSESELAKAAKAAAELEKVNRSETFAPSLFDSIPDAQDTSTDSEDDKLEAGDTVEW